MHIVSTPHTCDSSSFRNSDLLVNMHSEEWAQIVCNTLAVDTELHPKEIQKTLTTEGPLLKMCGYVSMLCCFGYVYA